MTNERIILLILTCVIGIASGFFTYKETLPKIGINNVLYWSLVGFCLLALFLSDDKVIRSNLQIALVGIILGSLVKEIWQEKKM